MISASTSIEGSIAILFCQLLEELIWRIRRSKKLSSIRVCVGIQMLPKFQSRIDILVKSLPKVCCNCTSLKNWAKINSSIELLLGIFGAVFGFYLLFFKYLDKDVDWYFLLGNFGEFTSISTNSRIFFIWIL